MVNFFTLSVSFWLILMSATTVVHAVTSTIVPGFSRTIVCENVACDAPHRGMIEFRTTGGTSIQITDTAILGRAWGNHMGWITFQPTNAGVSIDVKTGILQGKAWSQASGWINFSPTGQSVRITEKGEFFGWAWSGGPHGGWIKFDCSDNNACVKTDWRPQSNSANTSSGIPSQQSITPFVDYCRNITEIQSVIPVGSTINTSGDCVPFPLISTSTLDFCTNVNGIQTQIPLGWDAQGTTCFRTSIPLNPVEEQSPFVDYCPNISGVQEEISSEHIVTIDGLCIPIQEIIQDRCPNIAGNQYEIPNGWVLANTSDCIPVEYAISLIKQENTSRSTVDSFVEFILANKDVVPPPVLTTIKTLGIGLPVSSSLVSYIITNPFSLKEIPLLLIRAWTSILTALGIKRRKRPWGTVYDSITKRPIDPAYVVLTDVAGNEVATAITDINGRYGFVVKPGIYKMIANKSNYIFPSVQLAGKISDVLYDDLYFGGEVVVTEENTIIIKNIPLDQSAFDWNEYAKTQKNGTLGQKLNFYNKRDMILSTISRILFIAGFIFSLYSWVVYPSIFNMLIVGLYCILALVQLYSPLLYAKGTVISLVNGQPLPYSIIRVSSYVNKQEVTHKVSDHIGNYYGLVQNGTYSIAIDVKKGTDEYEKHAIPDPVVVKKGYINKTFEV